MAKYARRIGGIIYLQPTQKILKCTYKISTNSYLNFTLFNIEKMCWMLKILKRILIQPYWCNFIFFTLKFVALFWQWMCRWFMLFYINSIGISSGTIICHAIFLMFNFHQSNANLNKNRLKKPFKKCFLLLSLHYFSFDNYRSIFEFLATLND